MLSFGGEDQLTDIERAVAINALKDIESGEEVRLCCVVLVLTWLRAGVVFRLRCSPGERCCEGGSFPLPKKHFPGYN